MMSRNVGWVLSGHLKYINRTVFFFVTLLSLRSTAAIRIYPAPEGIIPSQSYRVQVNGESAFVYNSPIPAAFCSFDMNGPVDIIIQADRDIKWVDIRPLSAKIKATFNDSTIKIHLDKPVHLSIELNGNIKNPLFIFANPFESNIPSSIDKNVYFFKAGKTYHPGIIKLKDNQTLYIEGGAVVTAVIEAYQAKNIRICGRGILDGTFNNNFNDSLIKSGIFHQKEADEEKNYHRFINLVDCENIRIEDLTMFNSTSWDVVPIHCDKVYINNIKIISDNGGDDGIDVVRCRNVLIENTFIRTKDDCIAVKANMNYPESEGVDSVVVRRCTFWNAMWGNGLEIGFELNSSEVKNISFLDNDIIHVEAGATISIHNAGTATVRNVVFENIRIEDSRQKLFDFAIFRSQYSEDGTLDAAENKRLYLNGAWDGVLIVPENEKKEHAKYRGFIKNIRLKNIKIVDGALPFSIFCGYDQKHNVSNVLIEKLFLHGQKIKDVNKAKIYISNTSKIIIR
ncbi:MAG: hypothetical protein C5B52_16720 [Bacteroidetes bacterium]|nr:MAG: hypothetical protein C5B52_16720 [Bacteroidota bacterium]